MPIVSPDFGSSLPVGSAGSFSGVIMPQLGFVIYSPAPLLNSRRFIIQHKKMMKSVAVAVMLIHHKQRLPGHFEHGSAQKYNYYARQESTQRIKAAKYHGAPDLVQSGKTRDRMTKTVPKITVQGNAQSVIVVRARYRFPFPVSRDAKHPSHITMAKMGKEISSWTKDEMQEAVNQFRDIYVADLKAYLRTAPKHKEMIGNINL